MTASEDGNASVWEDFCRRLIQAGDTLKSIGAPQDAFNQTEGARYLSRLVRLGLEIYVEAGDPDFPHFYMPSHETAKMGGDNPDNLYLSTTVAGDREYRITGNIGTVAYLSLGSKANRYAVDGTMPSTGEVTKEEIKANEHGDFTVIASISKPADPDVAWLPLEADSTMLHLRQTFLDRRAETPATVSIERISPGISVPAPLEPEGFAIRLKQAGDFVAGTSKLFANWAAKFMSAPNELRDWGQEMFIKAGGDPSIFYIHGYWKLEPDEALIIETDVPDCEHWNLQVNNWWMESLDYRYHDISVNKNSAVLEPDGKVRIAISNRDPGMPNWLRTADHQEGFALLRWVNADRYPLPTSRIVKLT